MPQVLDNVIVAVVPDPKSYTVAVTWANGETTVNSFAHLVDKGVFAAFSDPALFAQARVGERGRSLEWPGEIDFCADALWFEKHPEDAPQQRPSAERAPSQPAV
ncbi:MAG: DUF2442 domain-containing protein [Opitutales bacterium]